MKIYNLYNDLTSDKLDGNLCLYSEITQYKEFFKEKTLDIDPKTKNYLVYISPNCNINTIAFKALNNVKRTLDHKKADIIIVPNEIKVKYGYNSRIYTKLDLKTNQINECDLFTASWNIPECLETSSKYIRFKSEFDYNDCHFKKIEENFYQVNQKFLKNIDILNQYDNDKMISVTNFFNLFKSDVEIDLETIKTYLKSTDINTKKIGLNLIIQLNLVEHGFDILNICLDNDVFLHPLKSTSAGSFLYNYFKMEETQYFYDKLTLYKSKIKLFSKPDQIKVLDLVVNKLNEDFKHEIDNAKRNLEDVDIDWIINTNIKYIYDGYTSESMVGK